MSDADDIDGYTDDTPLVLPARLVREENYTPWWSGLFGPLRTAVSLLPSHKSTRKGRRGARHFRIIVGALTFVALIFSPSFWITLIALLTLVSVVPWLPLPEVRKRAWSNRLKKVQGPRTRTVTRPARIVYDGRRVKLDKGGNTLRRVLTDRGDHELRTGADDGRLYLELTPESGRKSETIWVGTDELDADEIDDLELQRIAPDDIDRPALVTGQDWRTLLGVLRALEE